MNWFSGLGSESSSGSSAVDLVVDDLAHVADDRVLLLVALEPVVAEQAVDVVLALAALDEVVAEGAAGPRGLLGRDVAADEVRARPRLACGLRVRDVGLAVRAAGRARRRDPAPRRAPGSGRRTRCRRGRVSSSPLPSMKSWPSIRLFGLRLASAAVGVKPASRSAGGRTRSGGRCSPRSRRSRRPRPRRRTSVVRAGVALDVVLARLADDRVAGRRHAALRIVDVGQVVVVVVAVRRLLGAGAACPCRAAGGVLTVRRRRRAVAPWSRLPSASPSGRCPGRRGCPRPPLPEIVSARSRRIGVARSGVADDLGCRRGRRHGASSPLCVVRQSPAPSSFLWMRALSPAITSPRADRSVARSRR